MKIWKLIRDMMKSGYTLEIGPHSGGTGYYAQFVKDDECELCDECESPMRPAFWEDVAHADTPREAVIKAAESAIGQLEEQPINSDHYTYQIAWSEEDQEYVGSCLECPSLSWLASDPNEALSGIQRIVEGV
jgi:hypothetical protein